MSLIFVLCAHIVMAKTQAGTTVETATPIVDTTLLSVQSGGNFIRLGAGVLPATIIYTSDAPFGTIPTALVLGDTLEATCFFANCGMGWAWTLSESDVAKIVEIKAHENASLRVEPTISYVYLQAIEQACDSFVLDNKKYTESGEYFLDTTILASGERQISSLVLTIDHASSYEQSIAQYEPYTSPAGKIYNKTGDYRDTVSNVAGCDSVILTHFTLYTTSYDTVKENVCDTYSYKGRSYTSSCSFNDTVKAADGSRVIKTIDLTVRYSTSSLITVTQRNSYTSDQGNTYTKSGEYEEVIANAAGCDSVITLRITIISDQTLYDTVYFCRGFNYEHEERISDTQVRRYLPYVYEAPTQILSEVLVRATKASEPTQTLLDLKGAETELRAYFTGERTPITTVIWTLRKTGEGLYTPIAVESTPQWVAAGKLAVQIQFCCGEIYNDEYPTAVEQTEAEAQTPVKRMVNGQLIILRGDAVYTPFGQRIQ